MPTAACMNFSSPSSHSFTACRNLRMYVCLSTPSAAADIPKRFTSLQGHYNFEGVKLAHGRDNALAFLKENPDTAARIAQAVKVKLAEARNASRNKSDDITDKLQKLDEDEESNGDEDLDGDSSAAELTEHIDAL